MRGSYYPLPSVVSVVVALSFWLRPDISHGHLLRARQLLFSIFFFLLGGARGIHRPAGTPRAAPLSRRYALPRVS